MYITIEISRPCTLKPWGFRSNITTRFGWLWFAIGFHPMREDELHAMIAQGKTEWRQ